MMLIAIVNGNEHGNGCAVFTQSGGRAPLPNGSHRVGIGRHQRSHPRSTGLFPSPLAALLPSTHHYGKAGVQFYTQCKTVTANWIGQ
jgi:malonate-semialdehyde dehydrogenase (acetylating)/methylmalonate-semialdehyde dehydrogenase